MKMKFMSTTAFLCSWLMITTLFLTACSGTVTKTPEESESKHNQHTEEKYNYEDKITLSWMLTLNGPEPGSKEGEVLEIIETVTHSEIDLQLIPGDYNAVLDTRIATDTLPEIILVKSTKDPIIQNAVKAGMFWDIGPYLDEFPNFLARINERVLDMMKMNGKIYGIPRNRQSARSGIYYRKDWADNVGLKHPETIDDLWEMMKRFSQNDPDQDGQHNTTGLSPATAGTILTVTVWFGAPSSWGIVDGKVIPAQLHEGYLNGLTWLREAYDKQYLYRDTFINLNMDANEPIARGKAGLYIHIMDDVNNYTHISNVFPDAEMGVENRLAGPEGIRIPAGRGYNGQFMFPKSSVKSEQHLKRLLKLIDDMSGPEIDNLMKYGLEGEHYTIEDGMVHRTKEQKNIFDKVMKPFKQLKVSDYVHALPVGETTDLDLRIEELQLQAQEHAIFDVSHSLDSSTWESEAQNLIKLRREYDYNYVMGAISAEEWRQGVQQFLDQGGQAAADEFTDDYLSKSDHSY